MLEQETLTRAIIGCAIKVSNTLGAGFLEKVYENALVIELRRQGLDAQPQKEVKVYYDGQLVGNYTSDIVVNETVILELKAVSTLVAAHEAQLLNYLKATGYEIGLLFNFGTPHLEWKRKVVSRSRGKGDSFNADERG